MTDIILKYPEGDFTQAELAVFNGQEKLAVYLPLREALAKGVVGIVGTRPTGKRPANVYRYRPANVDVVTAPPAPVIVSTPDPAPAPVEIVAAPVAVVELVAPMADPVAPIVVEAVAIKPVEPAVRLAPDASLPCPLCSGPMTVSRDVNGTMVRCENPCDPQCHENAFGHGKDVKEAYSVAGQKYKPRK